jgi:hypothetical protein
VSPAAAEVPFTERETSNNGRETASKNNITLLKALMVCPFDKSAV